MISVSERPVHLTLINFNVWYRHIHHSHTHTHSLSTFSFCLFQSHSPSHSVTAQPPHASHHRPITVSIPLITVYQDSANNHRLFRFRFSSQLHRVDATRSKKSRCREPPPIPTGTTLEDLPCHGRLEHRCAFLLKKKSKKFIRCTRSEVISVLPSNPSQEGNFFSSCRSLKFFHFFSVFSVGKSPGCGTI